MQRPVDTRYRFVVPVFGIDDAERCSQEPPTGIIHIIILTEPPLSGSQPAVEIDSGIGILAVGLEGQAVRSVGKKAVIPAIPAPDFQTTVIPVTLSAYRINGPGKQIIDAEHAGINNPFQRLVPSRPRRLG